MMWHNAGWYRGGGSAVPLLGQMQTTLTLAATDGKNADDFDNGHVSEDDVIPVITVPVTAPSALAITRRDPHWGITPAPQSPPPHALHHRRTSAPQNGGVAVAEARVRPRNNEGFRKGHVEGFLRCPTRNSSVSKRGATCGPRGGRPFGCVKMAQGPPGTG